MPLLSLVLSSDSYVFNVQSGLPAEVMNDHRSLSDSRVLVSRRVGVFDPEPGHIERWKEDQG
jgi:hypothetical protein